MNLARSQRRALCVLAGFAAIQAAPAQAADDKSTITSVMELVGVSSDEGVGKIDYSERPKLVLPPSGGDLPSPREDVEPPRRLADRRVGPAPPQRRSLRPRSQRPARGEKEESAGACSRSRPTAAPGTDDEPGLLQRVLSARARNAAAEPDAPSRRMLTSRRTTIAGRRRT